MPLVKNHGVLNINVFPEGADVWIENGSFEVAIETPHDEGLGWDEGFEKDWDYPRFHIGKSPLIGLTPLPKEYTIIIEKEGYTRIKGKILIKDGDVININDTLKKPQTVKIYTIPDNTILRIDGNEVGRSPWTGKLSVGSHEVYARAKSRYLGDDPASANFNIEVIENGKNSFTLDAECSQVEGLNGLKYKAVRIGKQCWMAEDYRPFEKKKSKGGMSGVQQLSLKVNSSRDICVALGNGWHMPYRSDWKTLLKYVGNNSGSKLRSTLKSGIDTYNFNALGNIVDSKAYYYTCKGKKNDNLGVYMFSEHSNEIQYLQEYKNIPEELRLIRCVKDLEP